MSTESSSIIINDANEKINVNDNLNLNNEIRQDDGKKQNLNLNQNVNLNLNVQNEQQKTKTNNIFSKSTTQSKNINIFTQKTNEQQKQKKNIFSAQTQSINLFNISTLPKPSNPQIFNSKSKALIRNQEDDKKSLTNSSSKTSSHYEPEKFAQFKNIPDKIELKFQYKNPWTMLKSFDLKKFRNGLASTKQHIYITLEKHNQQQGSIALMVRAKQTKILLFQGYLHKQISLKMQKFMQKQENIKMPILRVKKQAEQAYESKQKASSQPCQKLQIEKEKIEQSKPIFTKQEWKLQFTSQQDANEFRKTIEQVLATTNQQ